MNVNLLYKNSFFLHFKVIVIGLHSSVVNYWLLQITLNCEYMCVKFIFPCVTLLDWWIVQGVPQPRLEMDNHPLVSLQRETGTSNVPV